MVLVVVIVERSYLTVAIAILHLDVHAGVRARVHVQPEDMQGVGGGDDGDEAMAWELQRRMMLEEEDHQDRP